MVSCASTDGTINPDFPSATSSGLPPESVTIGTAIRSYQFLVLRIIHIGTRKQKVDIKVRRQMIDRIQRTAPKFGTQLPVFAPMAVLRAAATLSKPFLIATWVKQEESAELAEQVGVALTDLLEATADAT